MWHRIFFWHPSCGHGSVMGVDERKTIKERYVSVYPRPEERRRRQVFMAKSSLMDDVDSCCIGNQGSDNEAGADFLTVQIFPPNFRFYGVASHCRCREAR